MASAALLHSYTKRDGWELTGLDWDSGQTIHPTIVEHDTLGNGAYGQIQFLLNGDLVFNSMGGPIRV